MKRFVQQLFSSVAWALCAVRQLRFPKEFRIDQPPFREDQEILFAEIAKKLGERPPPPPKDEKEHSQFLADLGTNIWRLRQKMLEPGTEKPKEHFRREYRHLESIWDLLHQSGLEIQDHLGQPFDVGQAIKVIERLPTKGISRERVHETIKPTIHYKGKHIQMAEVFLETPETH